MLINFRRNKLKESSSIALAQSLNQFSKIKKLILNLE